MWEKLKNDKYVKELLMKLIAVLLVAAMALLIFDVFTKSKDGRRQIVDMDGGSEYTSAEVATLATDEERRLEQILSEIKGVGAARVMITYQEEEPVASLYSGEKRKSPKVEGVIVTAEGAKDIIVKSSIINAVSALFDIPAANVMVFEKDNGKS